MRNTKSSVIDFEDIPSLHKAARDNNEEALQSIIASNNELINHVDNLGLTPVIHGTIAKSSKCLQLLLESGATANEKDAKGNSPLMYAISREWFAGVKLLLEHGAKISAQDDNKRNAVHLAICCKDLSILRIILRCASLSDVNQTDIEGMTPIHWAAFHNWAEQLKLLLDSPGDASLKDKEGKTALHWAAQNGSVACIQILLSCSEERDFINTRDLEGRASIHLAAAAGHLDVVFELAQSPGCNTESRDREGRTALHWACAMNKERTVAGLLRLGVSYACRDNHDATPLVYARQAGHNSCANLLMNFDPQNPQKTLIPVDSPNEQKLDFRSTESKKMKFSDNIDFNSNSIKKDLNYLKRESSQGHHKDRDEVLDGLNRAFNGIKTYETESMVTDVNGDTPFRDNASPHSRSNYSTSATSSRGLLADQVVNGYSSDEDARYPPQMAVSPPNMASPVMSESEDESFLNIHSNNAASVGVKLHRLVSKQNSTPANTSKGTNATQNYQLGPLRKKEVPEYLRVHSSGSETLDILPPKTQTVELAPLKLRREKQSQSPSTISLLSNSTRLLSRESQRDVMSPQERPLGLRKKSLSLNQDVSSPNALKGSKVLSRSKSYGFSLSKTETAVLPSIKPKGLSLKSGDFFRLSGTHENGLTSSKTFTSDKKKKKPKFLQQPKK